MQTMYLRSRQSLFFGVFLTFLFPCSAEPLGAQVLRISPGDRGAVTAIQFSPDEGVLAVGVLNKLMLWSVTDGKRISTLKSQSGDIGSISYDPNGSQVVFSGVSDRQIKIWSLKPDRPEVVFGEHKKWLTGVAIAKKGDVLVSVDFGGFIKVWDFSKKKELATLGVPKLFPIYGLAISPNGKLVATAVGQELGAKPFGQVMLWNLDTYQAFPPLQGHRDIATCVAFSSDSALVASGSHDNTVRSWNANSGELSFVLRSNLSTIYALTFSGDKDFLAVAGSQTDPKDPSVTIGEVEIWNLQNQRMIFSQRTPKSIKCIAVSPKGRFLAVPFDYSEIHILDLHAIKKANTNKD